MSTPLSEARAAIERLRLPALYGEVLDRFEAAFPGEPEMAFVRAPGRVNLIGEHTDYNGLPVMPMAIDREIVIALAPGRNSAVSLAGTDPAYEDASFELSEEIPPYSMGHWGNYAKAAAQAVWEWASVHQDSALPLVGCSGVVGGSIPPGSGLSSSSALVVAVAVALVAANRLAISRSELADLLARGERYVGTQGGGMDQAASLLSESGSALKIDFDPLRTQTVRLPEECAVVVANSMVQAQKTGGARVAYNTRVAECRLGLEMLKSASGVRSSDIRNLRDLMEAVPGWRSVLAQLPSEPMAVAAVAELVGEDADELAARCLTQRDGSLLPEPAAGFEPVRRCTHVLTEGARVTDAVLAAERGDAAELGKLMNYSHASCAFDYEVSCPELDALVDELRAAGALGARLTGAGFGGCAVALVRRSNIDGLISQLWSAYYERYLPTRQISIPPDRESVLFECTPSAGAGVVELR